MTDDILHLRDQRFLEPYVEGIEEIKQAIREKFGRDSADADVLGRMEWEFTVEAEPEDTHWSDPEVQADVEKMVNEHGLWGWCHIIVTASWKGLSASDTLGGCSYESEEDFRSSWPYFEDMKRKTYRELMDQGAQIAKVYMHRHDIKEA